MTPLYRSSVTIVSTLLLFVISINSVAQHAIFKVIDSQQQSRSVPHTIVKINGMDYISLPKITKALGGTYTIQPRRMRVDLAGTTAWVSLNDNRVSAISLFSLTHKVVENDEGVFISRVDAPFFFRNAFQLTLVPEQAGSYDAAPSALPMAEEVAQALEEFPVPTEVKNFNTSDIKVIILDAGHGGYNTGLSGEAGTLEKDIVLAVANRVAAQLAEDTSFTVIQTRKKDVYLSDQQRAAIFLQSHSNLLISLHVGGAFSPEAQGLAFMYPSKPTSDRNSIATGKYATSYSLVSRLFTQKLRTELIAATNSPNRGLFAIPNSLFKSVDAPACMIELGCITNINDEVLLNDGVYQDKLATGIVQGIYAILKSESLTLDTNTLSNQTLTNESINE